MNFYLNKFDEDLPYVTSPELLVKNGNFHSEGLFSPYIFPSNIPTCKCGNLVGEILLNLYCEKCDTTVEKNFDKGAYIKVSNGLKIIHPSLVNILEVRFRTLEVLKDLDAGLQTNSIDGVLDESWLSFEKLNSFETNEEIYNYFKNYFENKVKNTSIKTSKIEDFLSLLEQNQDRILVDNIYVLPLRFREATSVKKGKIQFDPINNFYITIINANQRLSEMGDFAEGRSLETEMFYIQQSIFQLFNDNLVQELGEKD